MKKVLLFSAILTISLQLSASAFDLSKLNIFSNNTTSVRSAKTSTAQTQTTADILNSIAQLNNQMTNTDKEVQNSFLNLVSLLSSQQQSETFQDKLENIVDNNNLTDSEKSLAIAQMMTDYSTELKKNKADTIATIEELTEEEKQKLINNIIIMVENGYEYTDLAGKYTKAATTLAKTTSNFEELASNVITLKQTATTLVNNARAVKNVVSQISSIAKASGLTFY